MVGPNIARLVVTAGPEKGLQIDVPPEGVRIGRSSKNDVVMVDPLLSRYHCRVFLKPDGVLCVADLGSANKTIVNGAVVQEAALRDGDVITIGDTHIRVSPAASGPAGIIDLGFASAPRGDAPRRPRRTGILVGVAVLVGLLAVAIWLPKLASPQAPPAVVPIVVAEQEKPLIVSYEKVQASPRNIFRYSLKLDNRQLAIEIDDLQNNRHVRKETEVDPELVRNLSRTIRGSGFFTLNEEYRGVQPDILDQWDLCITYGHRAHRVRVVNRVEPEIFENVRQTLEAFGKNELGLWAIQFSAEKLAEMAREAYLLGKKLSDEREVKYGNLAAAIKSFQEAEWYLETVEVKPDFYMELRSLIGECETVLAEKYNDQNFLAERAIRLRDWGQAARELRILCDMIPDRSDPRNQEARKKLLDVEARLDALK